MEYKKLKKNGRTLRVYEDGRIYKEKCSSVCFHKSKPFARTYNGYFIKQYKTPNGFYYQVNIRNGLSRKVYSVHRLVAECFLENYSEELQVDHIDGNKLNNNVSNLRMLTSAENLRAFRTKGKNTTSKYMGVCLEKRFKAKKWKAQIGFEHKNHQLGHYHTEEEAALAYNQKALELGFAPERLNVIDETI